MITSSASVEASISLTHCPRLSHAASSKRGRVIGRLRCNLGETGRWSSEDYLGMRCWVVQIPTRRLNGMRRRGDGETERRRDGETERRGDEETERRRDGETERSGDGETLPLCAHHRGPASPRPCVPPSQCFFGGIKSDFAFFLNAVR